MSNQPKEKAPYWIKYALTIEEASDYFHIGEGKLRVIVQNNPRANYILWVGTRALIKRELFTRQLDMMNTI